MGEIVRTTATSHLPITTRAVGRTSTGLALSLVFDNNATGLAGAGGDATGVGKIYLYSGNPNGFGVVGTLVATITTDLVAGDFMVGSMHVDAGDNVHVAWRSTGSLVKYVMLTCTSAVAPTPTYTVGTIATVYTPSANLIPRRIDIDVIGAAAGASAIPVIGVTTASWVAGTLATWQDIWIKRTSDSTWVNPVHTKLFSDRQYAVEEMSVAAIHDTIVSNNGFVAYVTNGKTNSGTDYGDFLVNLEINVNTGAQVGSSVIKKLGQTGVGGGYRRWMLFTTGTREFTLVGVLGANQVKLAVYRFQVSTSFVITDTIIYQTFATVGVLDTSQFYNWCSAAYFNGNLVVFGTNGYYMYDYIIRIVGTRIIQTGWYRWDIATSYQGVAQNIMSGSNRNFGALIGGPDTQMAYYGKSGYYKSMWWWHGFIPNVTGITPANGALVVSDTPTLSMDVISSMTQSKVRPRFFISTDSAFGSGTIVELEDPSQYKYIGVLNGTKTTLTFAPASYPVGISFTQGVWYIEATVVDEFGQAGFWVSGGSFTISHPPAVTGTSPNQGKVLLYSAAGVTLNWRFTSPWMYSYQTAYEILITDITSGTVIVDTGLIYSPGNANPQSMFGTVVIPSAYKDLPLLWQISTMDEDGVASPYSNGDIFTVSDLPVPVFVNPTAGATLTNGVPLVSWTPGISSQKTQVAFRLMVTQGAVVLHDSNWQLSSNTSWQIPPGLLHTGNSYTFQLWVRDSLNLTGLVSETVTTAWTPPPAASAQTAYVYEYTRRGFVYIGWSNVNYTTGFQRYNLYRRAAGEVAFTLLQTFTDVNLVYGYQDYGCRAQTFYEYYVTQVISSNGDLIETAIGTTIKLTTPVSTYFLLDPLGISSAVPLYGAKSDEFNEDYETETYHVIGAGMHTDYGDYLGHSGTLVCSLTDRTISGVARINSALNPAMQGLNPDNSPANWTVALNGTTGNVGWDQLNHMEPAPDGKFNNAYLFADGLATTTSDYVQLTGDANTGILPCANVGDTFTGSVWIAKIPGAAFVPTVYLGAILSDGTHTSTLLSGVLTAVDTYEPTVANGGSDSTNAQTWVRFAYTMTVASPIVSPVTSIQPIVRIRNGSGSTAQLDVIFGGVQFEPGSAANRYFDGDEHGCQWYAGEWVSSSTTDGLYSAYEQRADISGMRALQRPLFLRSAYGDLWSVIPGTLGMSRTAGVGGSDIGDYTIPYQEVGY